MGDIPWGLPCGNPALLVDVPKPSPHRDSLHPCQLHCPPRAPQSQEFPWNLLPAGFGLSGANQVFKTCFGGTEVDTAGSGISPVPPPVG